MAEIPIEKKSGMGWLWLLLAAIIAALLIWWLVAGNDDDADVVDEDVPAMNADADPALDPNASMVDGDDAAMAGAGAAAAGAYAVGDTVDLDGARVIEATGDMAFTVDVNGEPMTVLFNEVPTPNRPPEGQLDINAGSMVDIDGVVRSASDPLPDGITATLPAGTERYIHATEIDMSDG